MAKSKIQNPKSKIESPIVSIIMGSTSDWDTMKNASDILTDFDIAHECKVVSAHRTPDLLFEFAKTAESRGIEVIIAGAGGAAHLPGMCASQTVLPVLGVPVQSKALSGMDSLLSIVQMPAGIPVGTLAIGNAGAKNAALFAISILANSRPALRDKLKEFRANQTKSVLESELL
ncbi:MAG: 5-(carboxyamino)imidazole ribonucleotide mutase [Pyrinomonadaceae bacterium]